MSSMDSKSFLKGVGMGMAIGASMGMLMAPKKKGDNVIGRALKAAGELADNNTEAIRCRQSRPASGHSGDGAGAPRYIK